MVADDTADATGTPVGADAIPRIGRSPDSELLIQQSHSSYILGYNTRKQHLSNPRFRHTLARLIDGEYIADTVIDGYGQPAVGPLWGTEWYPAELEWAEDNPLAGFLGNDGELHTDRVRDAFREAGYRYDGSKLIGGRA
ncbi:ABC transporter substrate-binding protein [Salinigranum rubrum]|nr:ABC transporter substrate-binding protein [Salinigranum rubrum]